MRHPTDNSHALSRDLEFKLSIRTMRNLVPDCTEKIRPLCYFSTNFRGSVAIVKTGRAKLITPSVSFLSSRSVIPLPDVVRSRKKRADETHRRLFLSRRARRDERERERKRMVARVTL